jgi:uncharacterized cupredoxin-like copper-binding protein
MQRHARTGEWSRRGRGLAVPVVAALLLAAALGACGSARAASQAPVDITMQDFSLKASTLEVPAGEVTFDVTNNGPSTHELNVDRTTLSDAALPLDSSGLQVNEASPALHREGSVESAGLGTRHKLTLDLAPGTYTLYCNLEGHYLSGMHMQLHVG